MTKLGATTASSSAEISQGLEKFAAVSNTVGLSYEYAASALATVTATTRQSADVVGNAFRTLFSRLEGLQLGETLEDGVDLNKYSKALAAVGVEILDANKQLKDMDTILEETASKWDTLDRAQQTALATTIGGARQYATFIALMDNWDFMQKNLETSYGASGTLQKQADIYAESWEGAKKRVQASLQGIYQDLIDDKFFIKLNNGLADILSGVDKFIDGMGGLKGILIPLLSFAAQALSTHIGPAMEKLIQNIKVLTGGASKVYTEMQQNFQDTLDKELATGKYDASQEAELRGSNSLLLAKTKLSQINDKLSTQEKMRAELAIQGLELQVDRIKKLAQEQVNYENKISQAIEIVAEAKEQDKNITKESIDLAEKQLLQAQQEFTIAKSTLELKEQAVYSSKGSFTRHSDAATLNTETLKFEDLNIKVQEAGKNLRREIIDQLSRSNVEAISLKNTFGSIIGLNNSNNLINFKATADSLETSQKKLKEFKNVLDSFLDPSTKQRLGVIFQDLFDEQNADKFNEKIKILQKELQKTSIPGENLQKTLSKMGVDSGKLSTYINKIKELKQAQLELEKINKKVEQAEQALNNARNNPSTKNTIEAEKNLEQLREKQKQKIKEVEEAQVVLNQRVKEFNPQHIMTGTEAIMKIGASAGQVVTIINSFKSLISTLNNDDASGMEKFAASLISISMILPSVINLIGNFNTVKKAVIATQQLFNTLTETGISLQKLSLLQTMQENATNIEGNSIAVSRLLVKKGIISTEQQEIIQKAILNKEKELGRALTAQEVIQLTLENLAHGHGAIAKMANYAAQKLLNKEITHTYQLLLPLLPMILAIAAAIAAVTAGIILLVSALKVSKANSPAGQLETAKKVAEDLSKATDDAAQKASELKSAFDKYDSAVEQLKKCKRGTEEWKKALQDVNDEVLNILQKYPELAKSAKVIRDNDGRLQITNKEELLKQAQNSANTLRNSSILANAYINQAAVNKQQADLRDQYYYSNVDDYEQSDINQQRRNIINNVKEYDSLTFEEFKKVTGATANSLRMTDDEFKNFYNSIQDLSKNTREAAENIELASELVADSILNSDYSSEQREEAIRIGQEAFNKIYGYDVRYKTGVNVGNVQLDEIFSLLQQSGKFSIYDALASNSIQQKDGRLYLTVNTGENGEQQILLEEAIEIAAEKARELALEEYNKKNDPDQQAKAEREKTTFVDIESIKAQIAELNKAFASLNVGDIVEDFSTIPEALQSYFQIMEDGTAKLIGDAEKFKDALFRENISDSLDNLDKLLALPERRESEAETVEHRKPIFEGSSIVGFETETATKTQVQVGLTEAEIQLQRDSAETIMLAATSYEQLAYARGLLTEKITDSIIVEEAYQKGLIDLATSYETCTQESLSFQNALQSQDKEAIKFTQNALELSITSAENAKKFNLDAQEVENYAKRLQNNTNKLKDNAKAAADLATRNIRLNKGIKSLADNLEDNLQALSENVPGSLEWGQALDDIKEALADVYDLASGDLLSDNFVNDLVNDGETLQKIAEGDLTTIEALQKAVASDIAGQITLETNTDEAWAALEEFRAALDSLGTYEIGDQIQDSAFIAKLNNLISATAMTKEQIQSMLGSLGMSATLHQEYRDVTHDVPQYTTKHTITNYKPGGTITAGVLGSQYSYTLPPSYDEETVTYMSGTVPVTEKVPYYSIETSSGSYSSGGGLTYVGRGSPGASVGSSKSSGGGGGSSKPAVQQSTKSRDDVVDRYKEVDDSLKRMSEALDKVGDAQDKVWGANRIKSIENQNELLKDNIELLQKKRKEAEGYYGEDQKALQNAASALGWEIGFNEQGDVVSYRGSMEDIFAQYHAIEAYWANPDNFSTSDEQNEYKEQYVDPLWEKIDILKDKLAQYDETNQLIKDLDEELLSLQYQIQDNNAAILNYKLELHLQLNERERQQVDNAIAALGDDFFKRAEVFSFMLEKMGEYLKDPNIFNLDTSNYEFLVNSLNDWNTAFENGEVSQAAYVEGLESVMDASQSAFDDLISWNKEMADYYADTLSAMKDEIDVFTKQIDRLTDRLEHYKKVMELIGHETDYDAIDAILKGQEQIAKNQYDISKKLFDDQKAIYEEQLARLAEMDEEAAAAYYEAVVKPQKEYLDELEADAEAKLEKILELANAALENLQAKAKKTLELSLTNGMGFEVLNQSMNLASKYQDEYLTKTNQIYEINKLLNSLTQDMNKTNSAAQKERIKNFAAEMEGLKNQTQLSQTELKIAQARYAQLQAQIALEDARNAKSVVRLQRDSEGNFGYVYTADQDKIAEAEQNFAERTNDLYNLALETTNDYTQKIIQLEQEMTEALAELEAQRTQISKEEYQKRYQELVDKYTSIRNSYIESRNAGLYWLERTAAKDITEAWTTAYSENIASMENWKIYVEEWSSATQEAYEAWVNTVNPLVKDLADNENNLNNAIEETVKQSEALKDVLLGEDGVITRSEEIQNAIDAQTEAWVRQTNEISQLIERYQDLIKEISNAIAAQTLADTYQSVESPGTYISDSSDYTGGDVDVPDNSGLGGGNGGGENQPLYGPGGYQESSEPEYKYVSAKLHVNKKTGVYSEHEKSEYEGMGSGYIKYYCALCKHDFIIENNYGWFDTGGYTGSWGPEGRFAMLHEKELVLDKDDTKNVLASVELVRQLSSAIDLRAAAAINPIGLQMPWYASNAQNIEQTVTIHAEFPNATDHTEIQLALESLNNRALQYTSRR